jgi:hypothetical protein
MAAVKATSRAAVAGEGAFMAATPATVEVLVPAATVPVGGWAMLAKSYAGTTRSWPNPKGLRLGLAAAVCELKGAKGVASAPAPSGDGKLTSKLRRVGAVLTNASELGVSATGDVRLGAVKAP